jgi:hypothetical protein
VKLGGRVFGSVFRGLYDRASSAPVDDRLLAAIEKLNHVTDQMLQQDNDARAQAVDSAAVDR